MSSNKPSPKTLIYLTKENLEKYLKIYSANYIAKKLFAPDYITDASNVITRARKFGIKTHSISESKLLKSTKKTLKKTLQERYGENITNISQINSVKQKKIDSAIEKYGCINVFQSNEIKNKSKETLMEKYGVENSCAIPGVKRNNGKTSLIHKEVSAFLKNKKIKHKNEVSKFYKFCEIKKKKYAPIVDILIESRKIVIEIQGDRWHANPQKYKPSDIIKTWDGVKTAKDIWAKDKIKKEHIESFGYKVMYIWEYDLINNKEKTLKDLINAIRKNKINKKNK
jgi:very-short-patch-repair endonuclease